VSNDGVLLHIHSIFKIKIEKLKKNNNNNNNNIFIETQNLFNP
jgi:hypothetical protein